MIVRVEYNLSDEDDRTAYKAQLQAIDLKGAVWDFDQWLRSHVKYNDEDKWPNAEDIRQELWTYINEACADLD